MSNRGRHRKKDWIHDVLNDNEIQWLLAGQIWAGNLPDINVFKKDAYAPRSKKGFCFSEFDYFKGVYYGRTMQIADKIQLYKLDNKIK